MSIRNVLVNVIIPTYNRGHLLDRSIKSVLDQSYKNIELIVIDDGSIDNTRSLVEEFTKKDKRVKYFYIDNSGVSSARNHGINNSNGELLAFLDSDDEWLPEKLKKQVDLYIKEPYQLCHSDEIWIRNGIRINQMKKHEKSGGDIFLKCLPLCCISPSAAIVTRGLIDEVGMFDEDLEICEDYDLWLRVTARYPVSFIDEPLIIKYGGHKDQLSNRSWGNDTYRVRALQKIIKSGTISGEKLSTAIEMLKTKCEILAKGFKKHGNLEQAQYYDKLSLYN
ncbi:MAG: glycosyltransferase [Proteobacteria bacterium]|nr:glycosyltransferase [Pseudomonadota bacterium]